MQIAASTLARKAGRAGLSSASYATITMALPASVETKDYAAEDPQSSRRWDRHAHTPVFPPSRPSPAAMDKRLSAGFPEHWAGL